jgi:hypothetical protein
MLKTTAGGQAVLTGFARKLTGRVPDDSAIPDSIRKGVWLMLAGAAVTALSGLFSLIVVLSEKSVLTDANGHKLTSGQLASGIIGTLISYAILVTMWILMARFNRAGAKWARILASVFAVIATWYTYQLVNSLKGGDTITWEGIVYIAVTIVIWVVGVLSIAMIWRPDTGPYYNARAAR